MDGFDFEERYRNPNECNPFYWHPLHLPEECIKMYEQLIRANIGSLGPVQVFKIKNTHELHLDDNYFMIPTVLQRTNANNVGYKRKKLSPMQKLIEIIRRDSTKIPVAPEIRISPHLGPIALYRQPISIGSEKLLKKISGAYRDAMTRSNYRT